MTEAQNNQDSITYKLHKVERSSFDGAKKLGNKTIRGVAGEGNNPDGLVRGLALADRQKLEQQGLLEKFDKEKSKILQESTEQRGELLTQKARDFLYEKLWIHLELEKNSWVKNFLKWVIDGAILGNMEFVEMIVREPEKAWEAIKMFFSLEGIKTALQAMGKSIADLFRGNPYDTGKSVGELGLIGLGWGAAFGLLRKGLKTGVKQEAKIALKEWVKSGEKVMRENVLKNATLSNAERLLKAEEILGRKLSEVEKKAIIKAHEAGKGTVYNYTKPDLKKKAKILESEGNISKTERRRLMEEGIAGETAVKPVRLPEDFRIWKDLPPVNTGSLIYQWVEKISIEALQCGEMSVENILNLVETSAGYVHHNLESLRKLPFVEQRIFQGTIDALYLKMSKLIKSTELPVDQAKALLVSRDVHLAQFMKNPIPIFKK